MQEVGVHGRAGLIACRFVDAAEFVIAGWSGSCGRRRFFCEKNTDAKTAGVSPVFSNSLSVFQSVRVDLTETEACFLRKPA